MSFFSEPVSAMCDLPSILQEVLDGAMELQGADFGDVQLYDEAIGALKTVAHRGVNQDFLDYFQTVDVNEPEKSGLESSVEARFRVCSRPAALNDLIAARALLKVRQAVCHAPLRSPSWSQLIVEHSVPRCIPAAHAPKTSLFCRVTQQNLFLTSTGLARSSKLQWSR
jgi:hypothetical protein